MKTETMIEQVNRFGLTESDIERNKKWCYKHRVGSTSQHKKPTKTQLLLLKIIEESGQEGVGYIALKEKSKLAESTIFSAVNQLVEKGMVKKDCFIFKIKSE